MKKYISDGYSYKKISKIMGRSENSISWQVYRLSDGYKSKFKREVKETMSGSMSLMALRLPFSKISQAAQEDIK